MILTTCTHRHSLFLSIPKPLLFYSLYKFQVNEKNFQTNDICSIPFQYFWIILPLLYFFICKLINIHSKNITCHSQKIEIFFNLFQFLINFKNICKYYHPILWLCTKKKYQFQYWEKKQVLLWMRVNLNNSFNKRDTTVFQFFQKVRKSQGEQAQSHLEIGSYYSNQFSSNTKRVSNSFTMAVSPEASPR